jgi:predicted nucleic acid-binding protein
MVAAIRSGAGASRRLLVAVLQHRCTLALSIPLVVEYEAVLTRSEHLAASGLTRSEVGELLGAVISAADPVRLAFLWRPRLPDADDDMVLEAAINGQADRLVTFNQRHFGRVGAEFGIVICRPAAALAAMEAGS